MRNLPVALFALLLLLLVGLSTEMSRGLIWLDGTLAAIGVVLDIEARGELELNAVVKELKPNGQI